ncbi:hypothetical protein DRN39_08210 [Thermococci archaeon]|nr:MAG: hypothetical protein DRN39_08210 [Thermococci archaeon]
MDSALLLLGQSLSLSAKVLAFGMLAYVYLKYQRVPALYWSLSWLSASLSILSDMLGNLYLLSLAEAFWAAFLFYGVIELLKENCILAEEFKIVSIAPVIISIYTIFLGNFGYSSDWFVILGLPYAFSSLFIFFSGILLLYTRKTYNSNALYLGIILSIHGIHKLDYPLLRHTGWFSPIGFTLGAVLTVLSACLMVKFAFTEKFIKFEKPSVELHFKPGVMIITSQEYLRVKETLKDVPVLAFVRNLEVPETWKMFFITNTTEHDAISPTNLGKMAEMASSYFKEAHEKGFEGVVLIDCPEYLKTYNGFDALVKFLASLKDFAIFYGGVLILVMEKNAWEEKELRLLESSIV